jgi:hypothetical protein
MSRPMAHNTSHVTRHIYLMYQRFMVVSSAAAALMRVRSASTTHKLDYLNKLQEHWRLRHERLWFGVIRIEQCIGRPT